MTDLRTQLNGALGALRCIYVESRNHIEHCRTLTGRYARPEHWFTAQESRLKDYEFAGNEFSFIVAHWAEYERFRGTVGGGHRVMDVYREFLERKGRAVELNSGYFFDGVKYLQAMERQVSTPSLFDLLDASLAMAAAE